MVIFALGEHCQGIPVLGGPTVIQNLTDSPHNQNVVLLVLQNSKSKISEKSDQN